MMNALCCATFFYSSNIIEALLNVGKILNVETPDIPLFGNEESFHFTVFISESYTPYRPYFGYFESFHSIVLVSGLLTPHTR